MHPAPSVIIFTVFSGLGFGMLFWLGLGQPLVVSWTAFFFYLIAYVFAVGGLLSSMFHLGHPERFLKAFTQWKTSWLSREGVLSVATLIVMALYAAAEVFLYTQYAVLGLIGALLALGTVFGTSMIYAQLKTVPRWNHWTTPVMFMVLSLGGGALMVGEIWTAIPLLVIAGLAQLAHWFLGDGQFKAAGSTMESATQLGSIGKVRAFEPPHTGTNYLLREMVHQIGRKHAQTLRILAIVLAVVVPVLLLLVFSSLGHWVAVPAVLSHVAGVLMSRWLFFAQAEHVVGLYYGQR
ncbi:DmsC/YnfH family molybdoenzyme membrane anchor subunit [Thalassobium sp. R2A62]|jgi:DMSO reductase anchor subunit|uniref:dimethyl sulfoxide reductase anchor subunit family protein n=1 Tax=Thalassobium sp. R2A62 TaxID=633131 RepID=UPI0001B1CDD8|nr:DmsC/YnfH family molybdoenzyme membrane anchor subunit [Thalassobium sp. R2A62]EET47793.1 dmso reductase anchor subunit [Thalassobium sp. R2A62]